MRTISLGTKQLGPGQPCFVIAEAGVNHNGDLALAHRLVDVAADAGADAVKFQTFEPAALTAASAPAATYQREQSGATTQLELLSRLVLSPDAWVELAQHARERSLVFLSTPFDLHSAERLVGLGVPALKVPSGELDNVPFLREVAAFGLPLLVSTGMATEDEVRLAVDATADAPGIALLHCVSSYPAAVESANLRAIVTMRDAFDVPVGWSDHTRGDVTALGAVALGADLVEKHVTLDRTLPGPDHAASADPVELRSYVDNIRALERALGDGVKRPVADEEENRRLVRRSYHAARDLPSGHVLAKDDVVLLRPAGGASPSAQLVGRTVRRRVALGEPVSEDDLG